jgi:hypothetical protein
MPSSNNSPGRTSDQSAAREQHRRAQIIDNTLHEQAAQVNVPHVLNAVARQHSADAPATRYELTISNLSGGHASGVVVAALDDMYRQREQAHGVQSSSTGEDSSTPVVLHTRVIAQPSITGVESLPSANHDDAQPTANVNTSDQHHDSHSQSSRDSYVETDRGALIITQGPLGIANDPNKAPSANSTHTSNLSDVNLRLSKSGMPRPTRQLHTSLTAHLADRTGVSGFRGRMRALPHSIAAQLAKGRKQLKGMHKL